MVQCVDAASVGKRFWPCRCLCP